MALTKSPSDVILHILSFTDFADKSLCVAKLNKEYNKLINNDNPHLNEWISRCFDFNAKKLNITHWLKDEKSVPIDPWIEIVDGKQMCVYINYTQVADFDVQLINDSLRDRLNLIFAQFNKGQKFQWIVQEESGELTVPSWKHFIFQKEIVKLWHHNNPEDVSKVPIGLFEFIEVNEHHRQLLLHINQQKRGIALFKFISSSKMVRDRIKKVDLPAHVNSDIRLLAFEYAMGIAMQTYHLGSTFF